MKNWLRKQLRYGSYVCRHKWYVFIECCRLGIPWQGVTHDLSKFRPSEWRPYAQFFYGTNKNPRNEPGYYKPIDTGNMGFELAWNRHLHRNPHHWQWWVRCNDDGRIGIFEMPLKYRKEMVADWRGAGRAQGFGNNTAEWYATNKGKMRMGPNTQHWVEAIIRPRTITEFAQEQMP